MVSFGKFFEKSISGKLAALGVSLLLSTIISSLKFITVMPIVVAFYRCLVITPICFAILCYQVPDPVQQIWDNLGIIVLRSLAEGLAMACVYASTMFFPLTTIGVVQQTQPVFTSMFSFLIYREYPTVCDTICGLIAITGAIMMIQPPFLGFSIINQSELPSGSSSQSHLSFHFMQNSPYVTYLGMLIQLIALCLIGISLNLLRKISQRNVHWSIVNTLQAVTGVLVTGITSLAMSVGNGSNLFEVCLWSDKMMIIMVTASSFCLHFLLYHSMAREKAAVVSIILTSQVLWMTLADLFLIGSFSSLNYLHYLGGSLTITAVICLFAIKLITDTKCNVFSKGAHCHFSDPAQNTSLNGSRTSVSITTGGAKDIHKLKVPLKSLAGLKTLSVSCSLTPAVSMVDVTKC